MGIGEAGREARGVDVGTGGGVANRITAGVVGGLAGGVIFGLLMQMMGMMPMIAGLVGSTADGVGWIVHLVISAVIGATYGLVLGPITATIKQAWGLGIVYGIIWWILGPLVIMPIMMGMGTQFGMAFTGPMLLSLMGHIIYGVIAAIVYVLVRDRIAAR